MRTKQHGAKQQPVPAFDAAMNCQKEDAFLNSVKRNSSLMSSSSFTIEQWELTRRLRNSGLTKEQICQAYDDIERVERELGGIYSAPGDGHAKLTNGKQSNGATAAAAAAAANELANAGPSTNAFINSHFAATIEPEKENREIASFRSRGEMVIQSEISAFVTKHDLKQSQIARMAGVNQAYVSKFLRGDFTDLSENGKTLIFKWYLRFLRNPSIFLQAYNINLNASSNISVDSKSKAHLVSVPAYSYPSMSNGIAAYEAPKRTRFSFKPEHLVILEKSFHENQYPDQKRREELAKLCNEARPCLDRERVTEQIITHWFQNKRKITRKSNSSDDKSSNGFSGTASNLDQVNFDFIDDYKSTTKSEDEDLDEDESIY